MWTVSLLNIISITLVLSPGDWPVGAACLKLHPILAKSCDAITQGAHVATEKRTFHAPALTAVVFVEPRES